jgi:hypothetical protein
MADSTLVSLTADTNPTTTSILYLVEDPAGTPLNRKITAANLLVVTNNLTEDATPDRIADFIPIYDASASGMKKVLPRNVGAYTLFGSVPNTSPADATTYFFGGIPGGGLSTSGATRKILVPRAGVVRQVQLVVSTGGGTAETSTISLRLNNTTDATITASFATNSSGVVFTNSAMTLAVALGDYLEFKWVTPTWVTNPTSLTIEGTIWVS